MNSILKTLHEQHRTAVDGMFEQCAEPLVALAARCSEALQNNKKLLFCGNGGSACDAMHIAGEFVGRFVNDRRSLAAIALPADSGLLTAIGNDYSFADIYARQVEGLGQAGDVLITLSTSGKSPNIVKALEVGRARGLVTALFTGEKGRMQTDKADITLIVPSLITAHVQEAHITALHALASLIEAELFPQT
ncbi:MAG: SIS domain-containing protein [Rickettsiales bacterium]